MRIRLAAFSLVAGLVAASLASPAIAQQSDANLHEQLIGQWRGSYVCGETYDATIEIFPLGRSVLRGTWQFGHAGQEPLGRFEFVATQPGGTGAFEARPTGWLEGGRNLRSVDFTLNVTHDGAQLDGTLDMRDCGPLQLDRVQSPVAGSIPASAPLPELAVDIPTLSKKIGEQLIGDWVGRDCDTTGALAMHFRRDGRSIKGLMAIYAAEDNPDIPVAVFNFYVQGTGDGTRLNRLNWYQNPARYTISRIPVSVTPDGTVLVAGGVDCLVALGRVGTPVSAEEGAALLAQSRVRPEPEAVPAPTVPAIAGSWSGFAKPRGHMWEEVGVTLNEPAPPRPGVAFDVDANLSYRDQQLEAVLEDKNKFTLRGRNGEDVRRLVSSIYEIFEVGPGREFIRATILEEPRSAIMRRHLPIAGFGGKYAEADSFNVLCRTVISPWVYALHGARDAARELKVEFNRALAGFDTDQAALRQMFADETMVPLFGMGAGAMSTQQGDALLASLHDCMLNWRNMRTYNYVPGLFFDSQRFFRSYNELARNYGKPEAYSQTTSFADLQALLGDSQAAEQSARIALADLDAELDPDGMEARIEANVSVLERMRPAAIRQLLAPSLKAAQLMFAQGDIENQAAREDAATRRMSGISIPGAVPPLHRQLVEDMAYGRLTGFTTASNAFFAGAAAAMLESCGLPGDPVSRLALFTFLRAGQDQATMGTEFATGELIDTMTSQFAGVGNFKLGHDMIGAMGCGDPFVPALSEALVDSVIAAKSESSGRDSLFARSCQLDRSASQCACIVEEGRSVIANIDELEYSRLLMERIIQGNPFVGMRIFGICRVGDY